MNCLAEPIAGAVVIKAEDRGQLERKALTHAWAHCGDTLPSCESFYVQM